MEQFLAHHHVWIIFFGSFLLGESLILTASALAAQGHFGVWSVIGWAYLGTVLSDAGWFMLAGKARSFIERNPDRRQRYERVLAWLDRRFGARPERALLFIKFVYGTRIATITYLSLRRTPWRVFAGLNAIGTAIWLAVIVTVGWLAGKGLASLGANLSRLEYLLPLLLISALVIRGIFKWLTQRTMQE